MAEAVYLGRGCLMSVYGCVCDRRGEKSVLQNFLPSLKYIRVSLNAEHVLQTALMGGFVM